MGSELKIDLTALGEAATQLGRIATELERAEVNAREVTAAIGTKNETHRLRHEIEAFSTSWSARRKELQEDVAYLSQLAKLVADTFTDQDKGLAASLTETQATGPVARTRGGMSSARKAV